MSDLATTKTFYIGGEAAKEYLGGQTPVKRRGKKKKEGGEQPAQVTKVLDVSPSVGEALSAPEVVPSVSSPQSSSQSSSQPSQPSSQPSSQQQGGETRAIKVELKKKPITRKVHLRPKSSEPIAEKKKEVRKSRKITLGITSLHKRMTRAKKVHTRVKEMSLEKLRAELIQKKLIKPESKAPESVLRQIAADSQIMAHKAL